MSINLPLVSILIPSYNHQKYVVETLDSVMAQTYANIEVVIVDDGSKDQSAAVIQQYIQNKTRDIPMRFLQQENQGLSKTLNRLMTLAQGEYVIFFASDDTFLPHGIETLVQQAESKKSAVVVGDAYIIDGNSCRSFITAQGLLVDEAYSGRKFLHFTEWRLAWKFDHRGASDLGTYTSFLSSNYVSNGILIRNSVLKEIGPYDESFALQDLEYWTRLTKKYPMDVIPDAVVNYRLHGDNSIYRISQRLIYDWMRILIREKPFCVTSRQKLLWSYAMAVVFLRMVVGRNFSEMGTILRVGNPFLILPMSVFVALRRVGFVLSDRFRRS